MVQIALVTLIFVAAVAYLGRVVYNQFQAKSSCAAGCGKCSVLDFRKIEKDLLKKGF